MKVELIKYPSETDWLLMKRCTLVTVSKDSDKPPTPEFRRNILRAMHSPIRVLEFCFSIEDIPYYASVHLCRHVHALPFVQTQRNDRQENYDRTKAPQDSPVNMMYFINAEELITIAHKRLCSKADPVTREIVQMMCERVWEVCPEFEGILVPNCEYRNGLCTEIDPCGRGDSIRATVTEVGKDMTIMITVPEKTYREAGRILLLQEGTSFGTMYYPDGAET